MSRLEQLTPGASVRGLVAGAVAKVVQVEWFGDQVVKVTFKEPSGAVRNRPVCCSDEASLERAGFGAGLVVRRRRLPVPAGVRGSAHPTCLPVRSLSRAAHLADRAAPHQITAAYGERLPRQPLRFLPADDPGAGKTIMAALLVKELLIRGDIERCLPWSRPAISVEQWQDELAEKVHIETTSLWPRRGTTDCRGCRIRRERSPMLHGWASTGFSGEPSSGFPHLIYLVGLSDGWVAQAGSASSNSAKAGCPQPSGERGLRSANSSVRAGREARYGQHH
jgi:hypothetical protein